MDFKEIWRALWHNKPILFALLAVAAVLLYLWWQSSQGGSSTFGGTTGGADTTPVDTGQGSGVPGVVTSDQATVGTPVVQNSSTGQVQPTLTPNWFSVLPVPLLSPAPLNTPSRPSPNVGPRTYLVVQGDTLKSVAKKLGLTPNELYNDNRGVISQVSSKHGGPYWDTGRATKSPPANVKLYAGTLLHF